MSDLVFHSEAGNGAVSLAGTLAITVDGKLSAGPAVASHSDGVWRVGDVALSRITCAGPIHLEIHASSERHRFGPFTDLVIGANTIWSSAGAFARYNAFTKTWKLTEEEAAALALPSDISLVPV